MPRTHSQDQPERPGHHLDEPPSRPPGQNDDGGLGRYLDSERVLFSHYGLTPTDLRLRLDDLGVVVRVLEIGEGDPVLFVHGSPSAGPIWAPLVAQLPERRCLLLDRPGCGLSDPLPRPMGFRESSVAVLGAVLDALDLPCADVVGSSLGGAVAAHFAAAQPDRVDRLVLEGCPAFVDGFRVPRQNVFGVVLGVTTGRALASRSGVRAAGHARALDAGTFAEPVLPWRDALLRGTRTLHHEMRLNVRLGIPRRSNRCGADVLGRITAPTLYLWGDQDPYGSIEVGRGCAAAQPDARLVVLPDSGHLPWLDDPPAHARHVAEFLAGRSPAA